MTAVLTDVFLMEAYVSEKMQNSSQDSQTVVKQSFYPSILKYHKVDSAEFYSTLSYYQAHPKAFLTVLSLVDSNLYDVKPLDTTFVKPVVETPKDIDKLLNFREQEEAMRKEYQKKQQTSQKIKLRKEDKKQ